MELHDTWHCTSENAETSRVPERPWKPFFNLPTFESSETDCIVQTVSLPPNDITQKHTKTPIFAPTLSDIQMQVYGILNYTHDLSKNLKTKIPVQNSWKKSAANVFPASRTKIAIKNPRTSKTTTEKSFLGLTTCTFNIFSASHHVSLDPYGEFPHEFLGMDFFF